MLTPSPALLDSVRRAFHTQGFAGLTMVNLARECGFTRRSLYNYFSNKEEAFRALIRHVNANALRRGFAAGEAARRDGGGPADIMTAIMDVRYGETRRDVETSPHTVELNATAFMLCRDIMTEAAIAFQADLAALVVSLAQDGLLSLRDSFTPAEIAQTLANGARGVNQGLPPPPLGSLTARYRQMCCAVLFGCAVEAPGRGRPAPDTAPG